VRSGRVLFHHQHGGRSGTTKRHAVRSGTACHEGKRRIPWSEWVRERERRFGSAGGDPAMSGREVSRRDVLRTVGGAVLGTAFGARAFAPSAVAAKGADKVPIIDAHIHVVNTKGPGVRPQKTHLAAFGTADAAGMKQLVKRIEEEAKTAGVSHALCMPRFEVSDKD